MKVETLDSIAVSMCETARSHSFPPRDRALSLSFLETVRSRTFATQYRSRHHATLFSSNGCTIAMVYFCKIFCIPNIFEKKIK